MDIQGLQKLTLLDYPGRVACTVFLGGCNLRCPYCHNGELVTAPAPAELDDTALLAFLKTRRLINANESNLSTTRQKAQSYQTYNS